MKLTDVYPFNPARFAVDSAGDITDRLQEFINALTAKMLEDRTPLTRSIDEVATFTPELFDALMKKLSEEEWDRAVIASSPRYTRNPDCVAGVEGCNCGLPREDVR